MYMDFPYYTFDHTLSGVGTVAAVATLAPTLFNKLGQASLVPWERGYKGQAAPFVASVTYAVTCVHLRLMYTIRLNLGSEMAQYKANADFQRDYYKQRKLAGRSPWNDNEFSI